MNRRTFFGRLAGGFAAVCLPWRAPAPFVPAPPLTGLAALVAELPTIGTIGGIERASFSFWRNKYPEGPDAAV